MRALDPGRLGAAVLAHGLGVIDVLTGEVLVENAEADRACGPEDAEAVMASG